MKSLKSNRLRGFTLVELLVVVGIIAILAGMLMPALSKARAAANGAVCVNQLRQIALATLTYAQNNQGKFPALQGISANPNYSLIGKPVPWAPGKVFAHPNDTSSPNNYPWSDNYFTDALAPYINEPNLFFCPVVPLDVPAHHTPLPVNPTDPVYSYRNLKSTYMFNAYTVHFGAGAPGTVISGRGIDSAIRPSRAIVAWDDPCCSHGKPVASGAADEFNNGGYQGLEGWLNVPHNNGVNIAYLDGHVGWSIVDDVRDSTGTVTGPNFWCCSGVLEDGWLAKGGKFNQYQ